MARLKRILDRVPVACIALLVLAVIQATLTFRVAALEDTVEMLERDQGALHEGQRELVGATTGELARCRDLLGEPPTARPERER